MAGCVILSLQKSQNKFVGDSFVTETHSKQRFHSSADLRAIYQQLAILLNIIYNLSGSQKSKALKHCSLNKYLGLLAPLHTRLIYNMNSPKHFALVHGRTLTMCEMFSDKELSINHGINQCKASQPTGMVPEVAQGSDRGVEFWTPAESQRRCKYIYLLIKLS